MVELKNGGKFHRNLDKKFVRKLQDDNPFLKKICNKVNKKFRKQSSLKTQHKKILKTKILKIWKKKLFQHKIKNTEKPINNAEKLSI